MDFIRQNNFAEKGFRACMPGQRLLETSLETGEILFPIGAEGRSLACSDVEFFSTPLSGGSVFVGSNSEAANPTRGSVRGSWPQDNDPDKICREFKLDRLERRRLETIYNLQFASWFLRENHGAKNKTNKTSPEEES